MDELQLPFDNAAEVPWSTTRAPISDLVRFGTSTWTYEGWQGQVYKRPYAKTAFTRECLGEFCQYLYKGQPLFRTVGNDSTFYRPPTTGQLVRYLSQIPEYFEMCFKVWEEITIPTYAKHPRYGVKAGQPNPRFLDPGTFIDLVLRPYRDANFHKHAGPFLFEFQRHGLSADEFLSRLDAFLDALPKDFSYSIELRNPGLLGERYARLLEKHEVAHVYNHWCFMPGLAEQHHRMQDFTAPFTVLRLLTPLNMTYEAAKKRAAPHDKIVGELPEMRAETVDLVKQAVSRRIRAYVLVNNRTEGNAPLTIQALVDILRSDGEDRRLTLSIQKANTARR
jgi:uncharacterized protein YecE (DUF72 family)